MASAKQLNKITLKGSAAIVSEFFFYGINSILYQRGVYPPQMFKQEKKYGLTVLVTTDDKLLTYLNDNVLPQLSEWLKEGSVRRLVVVIRESETNEPMERWQFEIETDSAGDAPRSKDIKLINTEIRDVIRQITATVTFLPLLETTCSFDLLFYTDENIDVPSQWENSNACLIENSEEVKLKSFSTSIHKVDGLVSYKFSM